MISPEKIKAKKNIFCNENDFLQLYNEKGTINFLINHVDLKGGNHESLKKCVDKSYQDKNIYFELIFPDSDATLKTHNKFMFFINNNNNKFNELICGDNSENTEKKNSFCYGEGNSCLVYEISLIDNTIDMKNNSNKTLYDDSGKTIRIGNDKTIQIGSDKTLCNDSDKTLYNDSDKIPQFDNDEILYDEISHDEIQHNKYPSYILKIMSNKSDYDKIVKKYKKDVKKMEETVKDSLYTGVYKTNNPLLKIYTHGNVLFNNEKCENTDMYFFITKKYENESHISELKTHQKIFAFNQFVLLMQLFHINNIVVFDIKSTNIGYEKILYKKSEKDVEEEMPIIIIIDYDKYLFRGVDKINITSGIVKPELLGTYIPSHILNNVNLEKISKNDLLFNTLGGLLEIFGFFFLFNVNKNQILYKKITSLLSWTYYYYMTIFNNKISKNITQNKTNKKIYNTIYEAHKNNIYIYCDLMKIILKNKYIEYYFNLDNFDNHDSKYFENIIINSDLENNIIGLQETEINEHIEKYIKIFSYKKEIQFSNDETLFEYIAENYINDEIFKKCNINIYIIDSKKPDTKLQLPIAKIIRDNYYDNKYSIVIEITGFCFYDVFTKNIVGNIKNELYKKIFLIYCDGFNEKIKLHKLHELKKKYILKKQ